MNAGVLGQMRLGASVDYLQGRLAPDGAPGNAKQAPTKGQASEMMFVSTRRLSVDLCTGKIETERVAAALV
ncbi:MAG: hypothetical protein AVDCRST_MAG87-2971 [uncultured Thermomicrobiales bacterium]|uniref:Uncharacterized protein n=1 Tax=uncultured Thermomicrobiales bacterium TaxID=1645740 RepID=A0A6J4VFL0_9BACT|nr:MAG: hypothetical protein AVDCRST_MAG87-2971 [uncultured Thermomicrobiales bacterium]